jgi:ribonuclease BN (tRNA processing enzyme)
MAVNRQKIDIGGTTTGTMACILLVLYLFAPPAVTAEDAPANEFITLGTHGGPVAGANRSQPANALAVGDDVWFVDAGDGAVGQLAAAGIPLARVRGVFLSHLHFDHTGGLFAVLGLATQTGVPHTITVYGPSGTRQLFDGLVAGMQPAINAGYGIPGQKWLADIEVRELDPGAVVQLAGFTVSVAENSHYSFPDGSDEARRYKSLSYRFDLPDRSIVYTGDTGPSAHVAALADGADLLVSEIIDVDGVMAVLRSSRPDLDAEALKNAERHLANHHLRPCEVGELASRANVKAIVITHYVPAPADDRALASFAGGVRACFDGEVHLAEDLDRF